MAVESSPARERRIEDTRRELAGHCRRKDRPGEASTGPGFNIQRVSDHAKIA